MMIKERFISWGDWIAVKISKTSLTDGFLIKFLKSVIHFFTGIKLFDPGKNFIIFEHRYFNHGFQQCFFDDADTQLQPAI